MSHRGNRASVPDFPALKVALCREKQHPKQHLFDPSSSDPRSQMALNYPGPSTRRMPRTASGLARKRRSIRLMHIGGNPSDISPAKSPRDLKFSRGEKVADPKIDFRPTARGSSQETQAFANPSSKSSGTHPREKLSMLDLRTRRSLPAHAPSSPDPLPSILL